MITSTLSRRLLRTAALSGGAAALVAGAVAVAPSASALGSPYADLDTLTVTTASSSYADGTTVTVSGSGLAAGDYDLSVCEYASYSTQVAPGVFAPIPACGVTVVPITVGGAGTFSTSFTLDYDDTNAHAGIGGPGNGQPALLDLDANIGEFVLVAGHGAGFGGGQVADSAEFNVTP
jgi:hypothetical protein